MDTAPDSGVHGGLNAWPLSRQQSVLESCPGSIAMLSDTILCRPVGVLRPNVYLGYRRSRCRAAEFVTLTTLPVRNA